jgi:hypothetical protein
MYKEYRDVTLTGAVAQMCTCITSPFADSVRTSRFLYNCWRCNVVSTDLEVAGRHRGRASGVQIIKTAELSAKECRRDQTVQYHVRNTRDYCRALPLNDEQHKPLLSFSIQGRANLNILVLLSVAQNSKISFPLPHRVLRAPSKALKSSIYKASRPNTFY